MKQTIGTRLRHLRKSKALNVNAVAQAVGCSRATLYRMEKDSTEKIPSTLSINLARFYNVDLHWLLHGGGFMNHAPQPFTDPRPFLEEEYDFKWAQSIVRGYANADLSTQKAICAILHLDHVPAGDMTVRHYLSEEELSEIPEYTPNIFEEFENDDKCISENNSTR